MLFDSDASVFEAPPGGHRHEERGARAHAEYRQAIPFGMSTTQDLVTALKAELKAARVTYAALAAELGMSESSIKRVFSKADMPLSRIDDVLRVLKMDFAELARKVADAQPLRSELTLDQERAVVADPRLLLIAICALSQWSFEEIVASYRYSEAECTAYLLLLDRLGIIELRPLNRYRLKVAKGFRWRPNGPVMDFFRRHVAPDYFGGGFDDEGETLMLVHGHIGIASAATLTERLERIGQDFALQHLADQKLPESRKRSYTLVVGMRSWLFSAFRDLQRTPAAGA